MIERGKSGNQKRSALWRRYRCLVHWRKCYGITKLRNYIQHWKPNAGWILFAARNGLRPRSRANVLRVGLKPILRKLGIPDNAGLHAFRHGLATDLAEAAVPLPVLQHQMRHADVRTTLKVCAHVIPQSQRDAMERVGGLGQSLRSTNTLLKVVSK
jgi:integrase